MSEGTMSVPKGSLTDTLTSVHDLHAPQITESPDHLQGKGRDDQQNGCSAQQNGCSARTDTMILLKTSSGTAP